MVRRRRKEQDRAFKSGSSPALLCDNVGSGYGLSESKPVPVFPRIEADYPITVQPGTVTTLHNVTILSTGQVAVESQETGSYFDSKGTRSFSATRE